MARLIDASAYQGPIEWNLVKLAGIKGAWIKATEGANTVDLYFNRNRHAAALAGVPVGAYHFAHPELHDPVTEARHFAKVVGAVRAWELRPVLDYEIPTRLTTSQTFRWITTFNQEVKRLTGVLPVFYSYPALVEQLHLPKPVGAALWEAAYGPNDGKPHAFVVPRPWRRATVHQFTSKGRVPGVNGFVDISETASLRPLLAHPMLRHVARVWPRPNRKPPLKP